jgi:hypothetical protein
MSDCCLGNEPLPDTRKLIDVNFVFFGFSDDDKTTAVFKSNMPEDFEYKDVLKATLRSCIDTINDPNKIVQPIHWVQIRRYVNDTPIPAVSIDSDKLELSCDWRRMATFLLREEDAVSDACEKWVDTSQDWVEQLKMQNGGSPANIQAAMMKAIKAYSDQHDKGIKLARRARIDKQMKSLNHGDWTPDYGNEREILASLAKVRQYMSMEEYSDDEEEEDDDDKSDDEEDDEDEEWDTEEEDDGEMESID